jgi:hypothetical protein
MRSVAVLVAALSSSGTGLAFRADGFWSGMSPKQLAVTVSAYGLVARPAGGGQWFVGSLFPPRVLGVFGFCGNALASYTRNIQSDADYASTLAAIFATYGAPRSMSFSGNVATGNGGGAFVSAGETEWRAGADRVRMRSFFDWRLYRGELQRMQPASVTYETLNPCSRP